MIPRQPTSPLFPYTTLFRSVGRVEATIPVQQNMVMGRIVEITTDGHPIVVFDAAPGGRSESTRLNSSHEWISYAVFCLKKKKINIRLVASRMRARVRQRAVG